MSNVTKLVGISYVDGIIKSDGSNGFTGASAGTDYQVPITLTTTGTSGVASFSSGTLNIPNYGDSIGAAGSAGTSGSSGTSGSAGSSGSTGSSGSSGSTGSSGSSGSTGTSGSSGSAGTSGSSGSSGSTGSSGSSGSTGSSGSSGSTGSSGSSGSTGSSGTSGAGTISGGTTDTIAKFSGATTLTNSIISAGSTITQINGTSDAVPLRVISTITTSRIGFSVSGSVNSYNVGIGASSTTALSLYTNDTAQVTISSAGAMSVTSSVTAGGNIGFTYSQGTIRSLWGGGYGGVVQIVSDNATSSRYVRIGLSDSNNSWIGGLTIDNNYLANFSGDIYSSGKIYRNMNWVSEGVFGYSSSYRTVVIGSTSGANSHSIAFGVDLSGNPSGAFSGYGSEYAWRNAGSFITPNSGNNGYNTLLSWNSSGQLTINQAATFNSSVSAGTYLGVSRNGSDTIGSGPYLVLSQTTNARQWIQQMSASLSLNFYHYNGSSWIQPLTLTETGTATFSSTITATNAIFTNDGASRVIYLRGSGNIIQFQDGNSVNKWEVVGRQGEFYIYKNDGTGSGYVYQINSSGAHIITGSASFSSSVTVSGTLTENSSIRYKENIETIRYGLDKVVQMRGVFYTKKDTGVKEIGLIAEELNEIIPDLVIKNQEGEPDSVSYGRITAVLIEAIKELKMEIEELKGR
jgi:hypothetical protein